MFWNMDKEYTLELIKKLERRISHLEGEVKTSRKERIKPACRFHMTSVGFGVSLSDKLKYLKNCNCDKCR